VLDTGERLTCSLKYYAYAVAAVQLEVPLSATGARCCRKLRMDRRSGVESRAANWSTNVSDTSICHHAVQTRRAWLQETYVVIIWRSSHREKKRHRGGLLFHMCSEIAQLIRGSDATGSADFRRNGSGLSLLLSFGPGCHGFFRSACIHRAEDALATTQSWNMPRCSCWISLLRRADDAFTVRGLRFTRGKAERSASRWSLPRRAQRLNAIRLDVMELTEPSTTPSNSSAILLRARVSSRGNAHGRSRLSRPVDEKTARHGQIGMNLWWISLTNRVVVLEFGILILALMELFCC